MALVFLLTHIAVIATRMREPRAPLAGGGPVRALRSARAASRTVADGLRLLSGSTVLRALVLVEVFWAIAMIAFETLFPVRLAELAGGAANAGVLMGPVSAVAWGCSRPARRSREW